MTQRQPLPLADGTVAVDLGIGEPTELPERSPKRGPPYWAATILRRALVYDDA